jgi:hypothetical protein
VALHSPGSSVGQSNCCWSSPAQSFLASDLVEIYDKEFCSILHMYVFTSEASSSTKGGGLLLVPPLLLGVHSSGHPLTNWPSPPHTPPLHNSRHCPVPEYSVGRSIVLLNCCWASQAQSFLASGLVEIYDKDFCSFLDMYVFRSGTFSSTRGRLALRLLHRSFNIVKRCHSIQVAMSSVQLLSLHYANTYFCQCRLMQQVMP